MENNLEQHIVLGEDIIKKISAHNKYKRQIEYLEKNLTVLFADQINQDF